MTRNANYIKNLSIYHKEGCSAFLNALLIDPDEHCSLWQVVDLDTNIVHTFDIHRIVVDITSIPEFKNRYPRKSFQTRLIQKETV
jgi:hypothetical protein